MSKIWRHRFEAWAAWLFYALFKSLPVDLGSALAGALARRIGPYLSVSKTGRRNLAAVYPTQTPDWVEARLGEVWENLGRVSAEFPHVDWLINHRVTVEGLEHLHHMRDDGKPGIFVSAHFGNWELAGAMACREGLPITLIYRAANNPGVEALYRKGRGAAAAGGQIPKGAQGARMAMATLKSGGHLGMLVDQKMNDGIEADFLGRPAMTAPAAARFALKYRCPLVMAKVERRRGAHFHMTFLPPLALPDSGDVHADTLAVTNIINDRIGEWVRGNPGQWLWLHKRWPN